MIYLESPRPLKNRVATPKSWAHGESRAPSALSPTGWSGEPGRGCPGLSAFLEPVPRCFSLLDVGRGAKTLLKKKQLSAWISTTKPQ